ncbi:MAG: SDR family oxidoreductase [Planctomycetota bacterium]
MTRPEGKVQYDNSGRVVIVTGGSRGIGRSICEQFLASGASCVCMDIAPPDWNAKTGQLHFIQGDTSVESECSQVVEESVRRFGGVDVLVNNAAIQPPESYVPVDQISPTTWDRMVGINFSGYTFMAKHALRVMKSQQSGVIVNIASGQGHRTARQVPCYGPIKAANLLQTKQWGVEYARDGIRIVSVSPGAVDTPLVRASLEAQGGEAELANRHPMGRIGRPEEIAAAVIWLSTVDASFITGTDLEVDGGLGAFGAFADPWPNAEDSKREPDA